MNEREARFKYRLEPLARLRAAQRDAAQADTQRARDELGARESERAAIARQIETAEDALRATHRRGGVIRTDEELRWRDYLRWQRERLAAKDGEVSRAHAALEQVLAALQEKHCLARALALHRSRVGARFEEQRQRSAANAADDRWLARRGRRAG